MAPAVAKGRRELNVAQLATLGAVAVGLLLAVNILALVLVQRESTQTARAAYDNCRTLTALVSLAGDIGTIDGEIADTIGRRGAPDDATLQRLFAAKQVAYRRQVQQLPTVPQDCERIRP